MNRPFHNLCHFRPGPACQHVITLAGQRVLQYWRKSTEIDGAVGRGMAGCVELSLQCIHFLESWSPSWAATSWAADLIDCPVTLPTRHRLVSKVPEEMRHLIAHPNGSMYAV